MPMHSPKVKSCPPTKVTIPHNLLFNRQQPSDFEINVYHVKRGKYHKQSNQVPLRKYSQLQNNQAKIT